MLELHPISINDKPIVDKYAHEFNSRSAEYNFSNMLMWSTGNRLIGEYGGRLIILSTYEGRKCFSFPVGCGELRPVIEQMKLYADANGFPFVIVGIEHHTKAQLEAIYPDSFTYVPVRDFADYVYSVEKLSLLAGKKLHAKRNHINRFLSEHESWRFEPMRKEHFPACMELYEQWADAFEDKTGIEPERMALEKAFTHFDALGLFGGVLFIDNKLCAFTIADQCATDCVNTHFEKAANINGAYAMINREFALFISKKYPHISYINREEDMGLENLRKAKLSYYPDFLIEKHTAQWRD